MKLIWHGTAAIEIHCTEGRILFDSFIPLRHSPVRVSAGEFDGIRDVFITHGHLDHIASLPLLAVRDPEKHFYGTETPCRTLVKKGIQKDRLTQIRYGEKIEIQGFSILPLHGRHAILPCVTPRMFAHYLASPARGNIPQLLLQHLHCPENDETVFYQIEAEGKQIALLGSLNLRDDIPYPTGADLLVLPYNGWDDNLSPALKVIKRLAPKQVVLDHYDDTFPPLTPKIDLQPILAYQDIPVQALRLREPFEL